LSKYPGDAGYESGDMCNAWSRSNFGAPLLGQQTEVS